MRLEKTDIERWARGYISQNILLSISRLDDRTHCGVSLHACSRFQHRNHSGCIEPETESAIDPESANCCDYFLVNTIGLNHKAKLSTRKHAAAT